MSGRSSHPCERLLSDLVEAFERIAKGRAPACAPAVTSALLAYGLIRPTVRVTGIDSLGPIIRHGYCVRENCGG